MILLTSPIMLQLFALVSSSSLLWQTSTLCNAFEDDNVRNPATIDDKYNVFKNIVGKMKATTTFQECDLASSSRVDLERCGIIVQNNNNSKSKEEDTTDDESIDNDDLVCSIYLAPSSIAGWGLYTSRNLTTGTKIVDGLNDPIIAIRDHYKVLPYRSRSRFTNWLGYIWPKGPDAFYKSNTDAFPSIPLGKYKADEGISSSTISKFYDTEIQDYVSVFTPGLASVLNSHSTLKNVKMGGMNKYVVSKEEGIPAGSELFMYYGADWHTTYDYVRSEEKEDHMTLDYVNEHMLFDALPTEQDKRSLMNSTTMRRQSNNDKIATLNSTKVKKTKKQQKRITKQQQQHDTKELPTVQTMEWLRKEGICIDRITTKKSSSLVTVTGRTEIPRGNVITATPMLALKRDDLNIYGINEGVSEQSPKFLNLQELVGKEEILNYCYGHDRSDLLLLPYGLFVNQINHNSINPNAYIRWADGQQDLLQQHPIDIINSTSKLLVEFVALRTIAEDEEITIDYGNKWEKEWEKHNNNKTSEEEEDDFRQNIGVPQDGFFPTHWLDTHLDYEIANINKKLEPGELQPFKWKHNGQDVTNHAYRLGLSKGFSDRILRYAKKLGIVDLYHDLLERNTLPKSDDWYVFNTTNDDDGEWFAQRYRTKDWAFNMHYVAAWSEKARVSFLRELNHAGLDVGLETLGQQFGLQNVTCFHASFMGVSECENSFTHTDVYASDDKAFNIIFPIVLVNGSEPELDIQSEDANVVTSVNYEYDTAIVMGDYGYHKTSPNVYDDKGKIRIVVGMYCGEINNENAKQLAHVYNGEDPAPFMNQFDTNEREVHWSPERGATLPK